MGILSLNQSLLFQVEEPAPPVKDAPKASPEDVKEIDYAPYEPKVIANPAPHSPEIQKKLDNVSSHPISIFQFTL